MPQPFDYTVPQVNALGAYKAGQQMRQQEDKQNALQQYLPGALQGNQADVAQVAAADPDLGIKLTGMVRQMSEDQRAAAERDAVGLTTTFQGVDWKNPQDVTSRLQAASSILSPQGRTAIGSLKSPEEMQAAVQRASYMPSAIAAARETTTFNDKRDLTRAQIDNQKAGAQKDRVSAAQIASGGGTEGLLPPQVLTQMAGQYLAGDRTVMQNLGRGAQGSKNIIALRTEIERQAREGGIKPAQVAAIIGEFEGFKAGQRTLGNRTASFGMAVSEATQMAGLVEETSSQVNRSQYIPVNRALQAFSKNTGDPKIVQFGAALNSFINAYARAISPTGVPTVSDKDHAREMLETAQSDEQVKGVMKILRREMELAGRAPGIVKDEMRTLLTGEHPAPAQTTPTRPQVGTVKGGYRYMGGDPALPSSWKKQ
jgi:hypothetical protein